jgi:hypothetical protein
LRQTLYKRSAINMYEPLMLFSIYIYRKEKERKTKYSLKKALQKDSEHYKNTIGHNKKGER